MINQIDQLKVAVRQLQNKVDKLSNIRGDSYINVKRAGGGTTLSLNKTAITAGQSRSNPIRKAYAEADAGLGSTIDCFLDVDAQGTAVEVNCSISNGTALNSASPRLENGDLIFVAQVGEEWWCLTVFQNTEECTCTPP